MVPGIITQIGGGGLPAFLATRSKKQSWKIANTKLILIEASVSLSGDVCIGSLRIEPC